MTDVFIYNGNIDRFVDYNFIKFVHEQQKSKELILILTTNGGSPDAAYKIGRYLQLRYDKISVFVSGLCKSAGTIIAIAASELIFCPYGELGPLDVQMAKTDKIAGLDSGLNISESLLTLENRARDTFHKLVLEIISSSGGIVSFHTASHSAAEIVSALYGPVFGRIDPEEVGSRARAMRIGEDYGVRLNEKYQNLKQGALEMMSQTYSSHAFVIDMKEASVLFQRVREANEEEKKLIEAIGMDCRMPGIKPTYENITDKYNDILNGANNGGKNGSTTTQAKKQSKPTKTTRAKTNGRNTRKTKRS